MLYVGTYINWQGFIQGASGQAVWRTGTTCLLFTPPIHDTNQTVPTTQLPLDSAMVNIPLPPLQPRGTPHGHSHPEFHHQDPSQGSKVQRYTICTAPHRTTPHLGPLYPSCFASQGLSRKITLPFFRFRFCSRPPSLLSGLSGSPSTCVSLRICASCSCRLPSNSHELQHHPRRTGIDERRQGIRDSIFRLASDSNAPFVCASLVAERAAQSTTVQRPSTLTDPTVALVVCGSVFDSPLNRALRLP